MQHSLGLIEVMGMSLAITVADVMAKTASVRLLGVERTNGLGWMLVKIDGDVAAVRTALTAGEETAKSCRGFIARTTIARPAKGTGELVSPIRRQTAAVETDDTPALAARPATHPAETTDDAAPSTVAITVDEHLATGTVATTDDAASATTESISVENVAADSAQLAAVEALADTAGVASTTAEIMTAEDTVGNIAGPVAADNAQLAADETVADTAGVASAGETAGFTDTPARKKAKSVPASADVLQVTCKICGDPLCGRHKGEPRSRCLHYQKPVLR